MEQLTPLDLRLIGAVDISIAGLFIVTAISLRARVALNLRVLLLLCGEFPSPFIPSVIIVDLNESFGKPPTFFLDDFFVDLVPKDPREYVSPCEPVEETKYEHWDA